MAEEKRDGGQGMEFGEVEGRIADAWEDDTWPGEPESVEGTVMMVGESRPTPWERMLEALESGELSSAPPLDDGGEEALRASIAERTIAHPEWPARSRR